MTRSKRPENFKLGIRRPSPATGGATMSTKIIVSYDGTANEDDAIALGRVFGQRRRRAGARLRAPLPASPTSTARSSPRARPRSCWSAAPRCSATPTSPAPRRHRPLDAARACARSPSARAPSVVVFCSDSHTATRPRLDRQLRRSSCSRAAASASRSRPSASPTTREVACSRSSRSATPTAARAQTADALAGALGATVAPVANDAGRPAGRRLAPRGRARPRRRSAPRPRT